jgi:hypothetical protein
MHVHDTDVDPAQSMHYCGEASDGTFTSTVGVGTLSEFLLTVMSCAASHT